MVFEQADSAFLKHGDSSIAQNSNLNFANAVGSGGSFEIPQAASTASSFLPAGSVDSGFISFSPNSASQNMWGLSDLGSSSDNGGWDQFADRQRMRGNQDGDRDKGRWGKSEDWGDKVHDASAESVPSNSQPGAESSEQQALARALNQLNKLTSGLGQEDPQLTAALTKLEGQSAGNANTTTPTTGDVSTANQIGAVSTPSDVSTANQTGEVSTPSDVSTANQTGEVSTPSDVSSAPSPNSTPGTNSSTSESAATQPQGSSATPTGDSSQTVSGTSTGDTGLTQLPSGTFTMYDGAGNTAGIEEMEQALGRTINMETSLAPPGEYGNPASGTLASGNTWLTSDFQQYLQQTPDGTPIIAVPLVQSNGDTLANAAAGNDNANFTAMAQALVNAGEGNAVLRIGWEANGNWYPWSADSDPQEYIQAFQNAVTAMRSVPGANFTIDWDVNAGQSNMPAGDTLASFYPGNNFVNDIGIDAYDVGSWNNLLNEPMGLNQVQQFAEQNGKTFSVDEWGLWDSSQGGNGDDPTYINEMANFFANTPNLLYQSYFNDTTDGALALNTNPNSEAAFVQDFGAPGSTTAAVSAASS
jgi:Glycosyl hydrolase family 26